MRFIRWVLIVWLSMVTLIGGAMLYGRAHIELNELRELGFGICQGEPCWQGIKPGMGWDGAQTQLDQLGGKRTSYMTGELTVQGNDVQIVASSDLQRVGQLGMVIRPDSTSPLLYQFIEQYGVPCGIGLEGGVFPRVVYPSMVIHAQSTQVQGQLSFYTPITDITLFEERLSCRMIMTSAPWLGFASWDNYVVHGLR